jgi:hypothetical protein
MSANLFLLAWAATLADQLAGLPGAGAVAGVAAALFLALEFPRQRRAIQAVLLVLVAAGALAALLAPDPLAALLAGARRGAAYAAFFLALGCLRDAAERSRTVRRSGAHLVSQPPSRRYLAVTGGAHLFAMILSYGAIDLVGAMLARAGAARGTVRRLLMGAYRGFATMNCWSPLNIMTVVVSAAVPAADLRLVMPAAFAMAMLLLLAGALVDRLEAGRGAEGASPPSGERWTIHLRIAAIVALVMAGAEAVALGFGVTLATGVTAAVPAVGAGWTLVQLGRRRAALFPRRLRAFHARLPAFRGEAALLAGSGFLGVTLGMALPPGGLAAFLPAMPALLVPLAVPLLLIATSLLGLNPIAVVAVIGAAVPDPAALGVPPAVLAFACMLGWGVGVGMTPLSASALATARWGGADPWVVTTRWNRAFTLVGLALALAAIAAAQAGWIPGLD